MYKRLFSAAFAAVAVALLLGGTSSASTAGQRNQAKNILAEIKAANALITKDAAIVNSSTRMAALTNDTTQLESQLQSISVPAKAVGLVRTLNSTYYKLGYDAAALEPVFGTADKQLLETLENNVAADLSVANIDAIQSESALYPMTIPSAHVVVHATKHLTWSNWRTSSFVLHDVEPVIRVGWDILIASTVISVLLMVRKLLRSSHGLVP
jgi:hypothetical protein